MKTSSPRFWKWPLDQFTDRVLHEKSVLVALAGPVAEMTHGGEPFHPGFVAEWAADWKLAWEAAAPRSPLDQKRLAYLEQTTARLYRPLDRSTGRTTGRRWRRSWTIASPTKHSTEKRWNTSCGGGLAEELPEKSVKRGNRIDCSRIEHPVGGKNANHPERFASNDSDNEQHLKRTRQSFPMLTIIRSYLGAKSDGRFAERSAQCRLNTTLPALPLRL